MKQASASKRIFIVDDHPIVRQGITALLDGKADLRAVGSTDTVQGALSAAQEKEIDLMVVDLSLKDSDGLDLLEKMQERFPEVKLLVLSMHGGALIVQRAIKLGARGFVHKEDADQCIVQAIQHILLGGTFFSENAGPEIKQNESAEYNQVQVLLKNLSSREFSILSEISDGKTNAEIAHILSISPRTVEAHKENLKRKLHLSSNQELTVFSAKIKTKIP